MNDTPESGELDPVETDQAPDALDPDRSYDNLEDAMGALRGDDDTEEQPDEPEADEAEASAEGEEDSDADETDEDGEEDDAEPDEVDGDAEITLPDGSAITVAELEGWRAGAMRQADYTQKTSELAEQRRQVEALESEYSDRLKFVETAQQNLTEYLQGLIPEEPSLSLAQKDPAQYQYQNALRQQAIAEIGRVLEMKKEVDGNKGQAGEADQKRYVEGERAKLVKAMPHLSDPARFETFRKSAVESAVNDFGFSQEDAENTHDARVLQLVHYARLGKKAEHNRNNAKRRVETPKQAKPTSAKAAPNQKNRQAMQRLSKTGSIEDALNIDF